MPKILGDCIDRLCTVEMRRPGSGPRGYIRQLYEAALAEGGGDPLTYRAAMLLKENVRPGNFVFISCNAGVAPLLPYGETDGPLGGAAVARAVSVALGAIPVFVHSDGHATTVIPAAKAIGLQVLPRAMAEKRPSWVAIDERYHATAHEEIEAAALIDRYRPAAMVALECLAPNNDGVTCSSMGYPVLDCPAYHNLYRVAADRGIPTIGVGDGGNEIGLGRIQDATRAVFPNPPGGNDLATVVATDVCVVAAVSNWGGYGIAAMLSLIARAPKALHGDDLERRMLDAICMAGAGEGLALSTSLEVDLIDGRVHADLVHTLGVMVRNAASPPYRRPF
jgi:D-glutamate cyclase